MFSFRYQIYHFALLLIVAGLVGACSKNAVPDPGPNFTVSSFDVKMEATGPNPIPVLRDGPNSGPQILLQNIDYKSIASIEKKLVCGPLTLQGKKAVAGDATMDNFRISETEFPGLVKMPRIASCNLVVVAANSIGSTTTKTTPLTLNFDKNPDIQSERQVANPGLNPWNAAPQEILLESFRIKNTLPYNLRLAFTPARQVVALTYIDTSGALQRGFYMYATKTQIAATRVEVEGTILEKTGNSFHETRIVVPVNGEVTLSSWGRIPPEGLPSGCPRADGMTGTISATPCGSLMGLFVAGIIDGGQSVSIPWTFDPTPDDFSKPNYFSPKVQVAVPGIQPAPQLNRVAFGIN